MMLDLKRNFELNVSHVKCKRAKRMVLELLDGSFSDEYNKLEAYANELRGSNPSSDVVVTLSKSTLEEGRRRFLRMHMCFHALKMGFNLGLRPFIGLDVVEKENKNTWNWFLQLLQSSLDLKEGERITFMSDMQKSKQSFPKHITGIMLDILSLTGTNSTILRKTRMHGQHWIVDARDKPIIKMPDDIIIKTMNLLREHVEEVRSWRHDFSLKCKDLYNEYLQIAQTVCEVNTNGQNGYEVTEGSDKHCVNLVVKKCTCRSWDLIGIPCPHAIRAILHDSGDPITEINWWYSKEAFLLTYRHKIQHVKGEKVWKIEPSQAMEPPELVKLVGRPKVKRDRQKDEAVKK
ncbi:uncharacterized protein LOC107830784 [Nicotiana tabacum]|uniref:Uncharacterized protein LOC107830784 n=1 Tax=Nicotiana tabacum TaxID=4097 RepID=A0AC58RPC4_TOBAC